MKPRIKLLTLTVTITATLLAAAAVLIVVGIFNDQLNWDIFGPKVESVLYGIFGSCVALSFIGVGLTLVLGTQEIVKAFQSIQQHLASDAARPEPPKKVYAQTIMYLVLVIAVIVVALAGLNHMVQVHRSRVFKRLTSEQMDHFQEKLASLLEPVATPPRDNVPFEVYELVKTLDSLSFISRATLYLPDPDDESAMWGYTAWRTYKPEDGFARFFVAKDFEKAMKQALEGDSADIGKMNDKTGFIWYYVVRDEEGNPIATLRIDGNRRENFREYMFGS